MLPFPDGLCRKIHRVAVALGRGEKWPLYLGDFGKGFVHTFDEISLDIVMNELDTITDFVNYLSDVEAFLTKGVKITLNGGEEDLLALYLTNGRVFPDRFNELYLDDNLWKGFIKRPEYRAKKEADEDSYIWDRLIEIISYDFQTGKMEVGDSLDDLEQTLRIMARGMYPNQTKVVGIATEEYEPGKGFSLDVCLFSKDIWTAKEKSLMEQVQKELGYFKQPIKTYGHVDEYPNPSKI